VKKQGGYMAPTKASTKKKSATANQDEMETKAGHDKAPLEDSFVEDLDIYGN